MSRRLSLEVFESDPAEQPTIVMEAAALEEVKLAAYETGYAAGWEDAARSRADDAEKLATELSRSLQAQSFSYNEARVAILRAVEPLLSDLAAKVLPMMARETLSAHVLETVLPLAREAADQPLHVLVHPDAEAAVAGLLNTDQGMAFAIETDTTLAPGQAVVRIGGAETRIDLDAVVAGIQAAIAAFFEGTKTEERHYG
ncbi:MAG: flagellar biosynthesis protein [Paracoccaceae bacterium]